jgi:hypothetical protein
VAQKRLRPVAEPAAELVTYDEDEWAEPGDTASWQAFRRWKDARHTWAKKHPDSSLGNIVDVFREEHNLHMEMIRNGSVA